MMYEITIKYIELLALLILIMIVVVVYLERK